MAAVAVARHDSYDEAVAPEGSEEPGEEEKAYYLDDEEPLEPLSRDRQDDKVSQRSQSLESVQKEAIGDDADDDPVFSAMAPAAEPSAPERGPIRTAREAQAADCDAPAGGAKELPPGAIAQEAPLDGPVEDVTPPSPSPGVSPQEHLSAALRGTSPGFHQWQEVEVASIKGQPMEEVIRVYCGIWNLHGKRAPSDLHAWIPPSMRHHIYAIGTCECEKSLEKSLIWSSKARWERQMQDYFGQDYRMIGSNTMSAVHLMVFLHRTLWKYCAEVVTCHVATGFANVIGNKGSTQVAFRLGNTKLLFMNCHLAAHADKMQERTQSMHRILETSPIRKRKDMSGVHREYDRVFFMGDLNTRVDASRDDVDAWLAAKQFDRCMAADQLLPLLKGDSGHASPCGLWPDFQEAQINFPPTYKFDKYSEVYDSSKKRRVPSWTDRILWKKDPGIKSLSYNSVPTLQCSDHRPVFGQFEVKVDLNWSGPPPSARKSSVCTVQ
mmetsp:Transcript_45597/g.93066  ORF Transcript_45597/g.93066 Transcript_45597/m.93066 type:complete len:494 (+) Transcript_45597:67-1548(+)